MAKDKRVTERERFEKWASDHDWNLERYVIADVFVDVRTESAWRGWLARSRRGGKR